MSTRLSWRGLVNRDLMRGIHYLDFDDGRATAGTSIYKVVGGPGLIGSGVVVRQHRSAGFLEIYFALVADSAVTLAATVL